MKRALMGIAIAAIASGMAPGVQAQTKLEVGYASVMDSVAVMIAREEGYFQKRGLDVNLVWVVHAGTQIPSLIADSLQIADVAPALLVQGVDSGMDVVGVAGSGVSVPDPTKMSTSALVARTGSNIKTAKDLIGKRVGEITLAPGTTGLLFQRWLLDNGVDPKQVNMVEFNYPLMGDALATGQIDAVLPAEPFLSRIIDSKAGYLAADFQNQIMVSYPTMIWITTGDWARKNAKVLAAFRESITEGAKFAVANPDKTREIFGRYVKMPPEALQAMKDPHLKPTLTVAEMQFWVDQMKTLNLLQSKIDTAKIVVD